MCDDCSFRYITGLHRDLMVAAHQIHLREYGGTRQPNRKVLNVQNGGIDQALSRYLNGKNRHMVAMTHLLLVPCGGGRLTVSNDPQPLHGTKLLLDGDGQFNGVKMACTCKNWCTPVKYFKRCAINPCKRACREQ